MDSGARKHITLHRAVFDTYEVISPYNIRLGDDSMGDDSMAKVIGMGSIVVGVETKCIRNRIHITSHAKVVSQFVLGEQAFVKWVEGAISRK
jgi:hypothetical protein